MKKYNIGIIGYGCVATTHIEAVNKYQNTQIAAIFGYILKLSGFIKLLKKMNLPTEKKR